MEVTGSPEKKDKPLIDSIPANLEEAVQEELGRLICLLPVIHEDSRFKQQVEIAQKALLQKEPNLTMAIRIRENIETTLDKDKVKTRLENLTKSFKDAMKQKKDVADVASYQNELAEFIQLTPCIDCDDSLMVELEMAAEALSQDKPNITLASAIRKDLSKRMKKKRGPLALFAGGNPTVQVMYGLWTSITILITVIVGIIFLRGVSSVEFWKIVKHPLMLAALAGGAGGVTSLAVRVPEFARLSGTDFSVLFATGFFRPLIGSVFAIFVALIVFSGIIGFLKVGEGKEKVLYLILGFISGFSEIFARDILTKTEQTVGGLMKRKQGTN